MSVDETSLAWSLVAEGDQVKSIKNGKFYLVEQVRLMKDGVHLKFAGIPKEIVRPVPAEPEAIVIRGKSGKAVDVWVEVLFSA